MAPVLEQSIEAAKARHPSGEVIVGVTNIVLTLLDRCDSCGGAAAYRLSVPMATPELAHPTLDFCGHHWRKNMPAMEPKGWIVTGVNPELASL